MASCNLFLIITRNNSIRYLRQLEIGILSSRNGSYVLVAANETVTVTNVIVVTCVCALDIPAATLVHIAIATN